MAVKEATVKSRAQKNPKPANIKPMLATLVNRPFDEDGWLYEVKWDGYRAISYIDNGKVEIQSRNNKSFNEKFYPIYDSLKTWKINAIVDGEIIVANEKGISNFGNLQNWRSEADGNLIYYVFDILWLNGDDLKELPLHERRGILKRVDPEINNIRISESFASGATEFFEVAKKLKLEGIIAKKADSHYFPGQRSKEWLKIKTGNRQEVVIGGYTNNDGGTKPFSALLVGVFDKGILHYTGKIGTGFSNALQKEMLQKFKPLITQKNPFDFLPDINKPSRFRPNPPHAKATWLKPKLICEVSYAEMTNDGVMRHPSFEGLREDKKPSEVIMEKKKATEDVLEAKTSSTEKIKQLKVDNEKISNQVDKRFTSKLLKTSANGERKTLLNPTETSQTKNINGHNITFNNLNKVYFQKNKIAKRDVINYYYQVAPYMMPYMKDRPQTLIRYPNGIDEKSFYQKDVTGKVPDWIKQFPYSSERGGDRNFLVCNDEASLLLIASLGGLEMHPWSSRVQNPDRPDWCIIDLDPSTSTTFRQVITAAQTTRQVLESIGVTSFCKTSGATGIHIYIPLGAKYTYEQSKEFARVLVTIIQGILPKFTSIERIIENRNEKLYLDFLQNRPQATLAAPYSLRPKPDATVSMPLHWEEVRKGLQVKNFTIFNAIDRVRTEGDIFKGVLGRGINMKSALKTIKSVYGAQNMHKSLEF